MSKFPPAVLQEARTFISNLAASSPRLSCVHLQLKFRPRIALMTFCSPRKMNAFSPHMIADLSEAVDRLDGSVESGDGPDAVILTGWGENFCAGFDVSSDPRMLTSHAGSMMSVVMQDALHRISQSSVVSVGAVDGFALGGGAELCTTSDFRVCTDRVRLQFLHRKMGVTQGWGGSGRLIDLVGRRQSLKLMASMEAVDHVAGIRMGLFDSVITSAASSYQHVEQNLMENRENLVNVIEASSLSQVVEHALVFLEPFLGHSQWEESSANDSQPLGLTPLSMIKNLVVTDSDNMHSMDLRMRHTQELFSDTFGSDRNKACIDAHRTRKSRRSKL